MLFAERGIKAAYSPVLKAVDPGRKTATFAAPAGDKELEELWISWLMKEVALRATYNAMLRGKA